MSPIPDSAPEPMSLKFIFPKNIQPKLTPGQQLKGFARVVLEPGQTRTVTIPLNARSFAWYDVKSKAWRVDKGSFTLHVSRSSADPQLEGKIDVSEAVSLPVV
jgi:beta-glucosidase